MNGPSSRQPGKGTPNATSIANLKAYADKLLDEDSSRYAASRANSSSQKFMSTIMSSGTLSDKISALTLSLQESPLHNRKAFDSLVGLAGKRSRGQAIAALGALVDLLGNGVVLPNDRRLYPFHAQPALLSEVANAGPSTWKEGQKLPGKLSEPLLMMWAFEDWLKAAYFRIIQLLEVWCSDEIEYSRSRALDFVFGLLKSKPEQEANLLRLLVNKLGDRERKIGSRASYLLLQLLNIHPGMKSVVIDTVEQELLLKPGQSLRTRYTAINTLNQTILSMKEQAVADKLLRIYFDMFLSLLKSGSLGDFNAHDKERTAGRRGKRSKHGASIPSHSGNEQDVAQKLVSALLTGVNRAMPFSTTEGSTLESHLDTLFRITHSSNFNTSVQALMLIQQLSSTKHIAVDRFYRTLYESLLDPRLVTSSKHTLYLNLLYRAMKNDVDVKRVKAFVKRLIQILTLHQPSFTCGILFLIAEMQATFPDLRTMLDEPEEDEDEGEEVYKDVPEGQFGDALAPPERGVDGKGSRPSAAYDGRKRNPEHSNAHRSCLWELVNNFPPPLLPRTREVR
jgi:ribosome biogenesis protein MAK21